MSVDQVFKSPRSDEELTGGRATLRRFAISEFPRGALNRGAGMAGTIRGPTFEGTIGGMSSNCGELVLLVNYNTCKLLSVNSNERHTSSNNIGSNTNSLASDPGTNPIASKSIWCWCVL